MSTPRIALLGAPFDEQSSFLQGAAQAPGRIREALQAECGPGGSANWFAESGLEIAPGEVWEDVGDVTHADNWNATMIAISDRAKQLLDQARPFLAWGGDHAVTLPLVRAAANRTSPLTIVHLDAHPDLYEDFEGDRFSHACPFARIMEEFPHTRLIQIGIRTATTHQREQAKRFGVETFPAADWSMERFPEIEGGVYLSLDMDALDPAFAPGVSHQEPGGLSTRDALRIIHRLQGQLIAADLVEFNPSRDPTGVTAMAALKLTKEIIAALASFT